MNSQNGFGRSTNQWRILITKLSALRPSGLSAPVLWTTLVLLAQDLRAHVVVVVVGVENLLDISEMNENQSQMTQQLGPVISREFE